MTRLKPLFSLFTLCLILFFAGEGAIAGVKEVDQQPAAYLNLEQLIALAFKNNPRLKAARLKWEAVIEKYPQITAYEDPVFSYSYFIEEVETRVGPQEQKFSVTQQIPFPGKLSLKGDIVTQEAQIAKLEFERQTRDLIVELKNAYYELLYITQAIEITGQNKELMEHLTKIGTTDYAVDGTTLNDVFKAQSQLAQLSYDLILLTEFKEAEITRINSMLNRSPEANLGKPKATGYVPLKHTLEELYQSALNNQQELGISELEIKKSQKALSLAKMEYLPNFKLGFSYIEVGEAEPSPSGTLPDNSGQDAYSVDFGISLPLWFGKNSSRVAEARLEHEAAGYRKKERENKTLSAIKTLYFKLQNSKRLIQLYQESLIPQAKQSMETAEVWYKEKRGSFSGLLETQSVWLNFNLAHKRALSDYYQRIAQLEGLVGVSLGKPEEIASTEPKDRTKELEELKKRWDAMIHEKPKSTGLFDFESDKGQRIRRLAETEEIKEILKQGIDLDSLILVTSVRNPGLKSAKKNWASKLEKYSQATQLDNILRQYQAFIKDLDLMHQKASVSEKFPFPGTLTLKGDIVTKEVEIAREKYLITLRDLIVDIKNTYYELLYSGHAIQIADENLKLLKHLESVAHVKYKTGQAGYSDVVKVQTRISKQADDLITWREYKDTVVAKLNKFLNLPPQFPLGETTEVKLRDTGLSLEELIDLGLKSQQELRIIQLRIDKTNLAIELAEKKFYPDFTLGFSYFEDEQGNLVGVGKTAEPFSLKPVNKTNVWFGKNDAYVREARLVYQALIDELESQQNKFRFSVKELFFQLDTARRDVLLYKESLLVLAKNNLDVAQVDYQSGKADFLDVLDAQATWLDYNLLYHQYVREQNQNLARLEQTIGKRLP